MSTPQLSGKVAIVTGASSGIGRATAKLFAREGARVVVTARRKLELDQLVAEIESTGGVAAAIDGDVRDEEVTKRVVAHAVDRFGGLDIAFNNAAMVGEQVPTTEISLAMSSRPISPRRFSARSTRSPRCAYAAAGA